MKKWQSWLGLAVVLGTSAQAANFGFIGAGARASGMGGAFIAVANDATSIFWNPGGLTHILEPELSFVGRLDSSSFKTFPTNIGPEYTPDAMTGWSTNFISAAYNFKAIGNRHIAVAVSYSALYDFDKNTKLGTSVTTTEFRKDTGKINQFGVGAAIDVQPGLFFGTALYYHKGMITIDQTNRNTAGTSLGTTLTTQDFTGNLALGLGLLWDISPKFHAGLMTSFRLNAADIAIKATDPTGTSTGTATMGFPGSWGLGLSWNATDSLLIATDYRVILWSGAEVNGSRPFYDAAKTQPQFSDASQFHLGFEYLFPKNPLNDYPWPWRAGIYTDPSGPQASNGTAANVTFITIGTSLITDFGDISLSGEFGVVDHGKNFGFPAEENATRLVASVIYRL